jgi:hypothetical protein
MGRVVGWPLASLKAGDFVFVCCEELMAGEMGDMAWWVGKVTIEFVVLRPIFLQM